MTGPTQWQPGGAAPPPFPGTLAAPPRKVRPGRIWYLLALAVFLGGVAWLVVGILGLKGQVDGFQRVPLPQGGLISLGHTGGYTVYYEGPGAASGHFSSFNVRVEPVSAGAGVQSLQPYTTSVTYTFGSRQGRAVLALQISHAGRFRVVATGAPAATGGSDLAFGSSIAGSILRIVLPAVLLMVFGFLGGIALLVIRIVLTSRRRAQLRALQLGPQLGPPTGPPMGPQPGPPMGPPGGPV